MAVWVVIWVKTRYTIRVYLPEALAGILHAEAMMTEKSISALLRQWIVERLALPEAIKQ